MCSDHKEARDTHGVWIRLDAQVVGSGILGHRIIFFLALDRATSSRPCPLDVHHAQHSVTTQKSSRTLPNTSEDAVSPLFKGHCRARLQLIYLEIYKKKRLFFETIDQRLKVATVDQV